MIMSYLLWLGYISQVRTLPVPSVLPHTLHPVGLSQVFGELYPVGWSPIQMTVLLTGSPMPPQASTSQDARKSGRGEDDDSSHWGEPQQL